MVTFALMNAHTSTALSRLRDIGWKEWDPIGLLAAGEAWDQKPFADEYDDYLRKVAADFRDGGSLAQAVECKRCAEPTLRMAGLWSRPS